MDVLEKNIYYHWRIKDYREYAQLIIDTIYNMLKRFYQEKNTLDEVKRYATIYPVLSEIFSEWLIKYAYPDRRSVRFKNTILYDLGKEKDYYRSIIDFISGMTDMFAIKIFNEITMF